MKEDLNVLNIKGEMKTEEIYNLLKQGYILNGKGHIKIKNKNNID